MDESDLDDDEEDFFPYPWVHQQGMLMVRRQKRLNAVREASSKQLRNRVALQQAEYERVRDKEI